MILCSYKSSFQLKRNFGLLYLDYNEQLLTTVSVKNQLTEQERQSLYRESGKLHLTTRSLFYEPNNQLQPVVKLKLNDSGFNYFCTDPHILTTRSTSNLTRSMQRSESPSRSNQSVQIIKAQEQTPLFVVQIECAYIITRQPFSPAFAKPGYEQFVFELTPKNLTKVTTELEMILRYSDNEPLDELIFEVRYKELIEMLQWSEDFQSEDFLLHHKATRLVFEGAQQGIFILTRLSMHFYPLLNCTQEDVLVIMWKNVIFCLKYSYTSRDIGIRIFLHSLQDSIILLFETKQQRDNIFNYIKNRTKFKNPYEEIEMYRELWSNGQLTNFQYLVYLNNLANRSRQDMTQYPIFPWVLSNYKLKHIDLNDQKVYRDLAKTIIQYKEQKQAKTYCSTQSTVAYYLMRAQPELLLRQQNTVYGAQDKMFESLLRSWHSSLNSKGDYKELIPEFYTGISDIFKNMQNIELTQGQILQNVKLPEWAKSAEDLSETLKLALESDFVSENLNKWIDLIFGVNQRGQNAENNCNLYAEHCYKVDWNKITNSVKIEAMETIVKEYGTVPLQLFKVKHPQRQFRSKKIISISLYGEIEVFTKLKKYHQDSLQAIQNILDQKKQIQAQYYKKKLKLITESERMQDQYFKCLEQYENSSCELRQNFIDYDHDKDQYYDYIINQLNAQYKQEIQQQFLNRLYSKSQLNQTLKTKKTKLQKYQEKYTHAQKSVKILCEKYQAIEEDQKQLKIQLSQLQKSQAPTPSGGKKTIFSFGQKSARKRYTNQSWKQRPASALGPMK